MRHFSGAPVEVLRVLHMLAKKDPIHHFVYAQPKAIQKLCTGKYRKGAKKGKPLCLSTVEKCLRLFEAKNIVSHELPRSPDPSGAPRRGRVVVPHEMLCNCHPRACHYVGIERARGIWLRQGNGAVLVAEETADIGGGVALVQNRDDNSEAIPAQVRGDSGPGTREFFGDSGPGTVPGTVTGTVQSDANRLQRSGIEQSPEHFPDTFPEENRAEPFKLSEPEETIEPSEPFRGKGKSGGKGDDDPSSSGLLTNDGKTSTIAFREKPTAPIGSTVSQHFANADAGNILSLITDTLFDEENRSNKPYVIRDPEMNRLKDACLATVRTRGGVTLRSRKDLGDLMYEAARELMDTGGGKAPKAWFPLLDRLRRDAGPIEANNPNPTFSWERPNRDAQFSSPLCYGWLHSLFYNAVKETKTDLKPWEREFVKAGPRGNDVSYRTGWQFIHGLTLYLRENNLEVPGELTAVADWLWNADAAPDKPPAPWREPVVDDR
jgi:hypothetical protein